MIESQRMELANTIMQILANQRRGMPTTDSELFDIVRNEGDNTIQLQTIHQAVNYLRENEAVNCYTSMGVLPPAFNSVKISQRGLAILFENSDWPKPKQIISEKDSEDNEPQTPPIFLSYSSHDLELVKSVKDGLEYRGLDSFMAKYDIPTSDDWKEDILRNLTGCEIFIAFLNSNYKKSDWTDHESGIAFIKGKLIITINLECAAYGFLSPFQSYEFKGNIAEVCDEILDTIIRKGLSDKIKNGIIRHFVASPHFKEARDNTAILEKIESFTTEQIHELMRAVIDNNQLHGINIPKSFVYNLVQEHHGTIDKGLLKKFEPFLPPEPEPEPNDTTSDRILRYLLAKKKENPNERWSVHRDKLLKDLDVDENDLDFNILHLKGGGFLNLRETPNSPWLLASITTSGSNRIMKRIREETARA